MSPSTSHDRCACPFHHASDGASLDLGGGCDATANGRSSTRHRVARERPFGVVAVAIVTREKKYLRVAIASSDGGDDGGRDDGDDDADDDAKAVRDGDAGARCDDVDAGERERGEGEDAGEV